MAGPVRSFISLMREHLPDLALISVTHNWGVPEVISELGALMGSFPVVSTTFTPHEVNYPSCATRLQAFGNAVRIAENSPVLIRPQACALPASSGNPPVAIKPVTSFLSSTSGK
jgi:hypothetical protein